MTLHHTNLTTAQLRAVDAAHHLHPFTDTKGLNAEGARVIVKGKGVHLWDSDGNRIIDGMSGLWNVNIGYGRQEIVDAVTRQMQELAFYNTFFKTTHLPAIELSRLLSELAPKSFNRVFFTGSGSESNDTIIRMVRHYWSSLERPSKSIIISRRNGYHGSTMASLAGRYGADACPGRLADSRHRPYRPALLVWRGRRSGLEEFGRWAARELARKIDELGADNVAAFFAEPIQGAGGVIVPPSTYWPESRTSAGNATYCWFSDEVICGFGRPGNGSAVRNSATSPT